MADLSAVKLEMVDTVDKAFDMMRWLGERRPIETLGVDIETGEFPGRDKKDALSPWHGRVRLAQIGDGQTGWAVPWEKWRGVYEEALNKWEGDILIHNSGFDVKWLMMHSDIKIPWHRLHDSMIASRIVSPLESAALKRLTSKYVDPRAAALQTMLDDKMRDNGWSWGTVPIDLKEYWCYGALDTVLAVRMWEKLGVDVIKGGQFSEVYDMEMAVRRICTMMEINGARVDLDYSKEKYDELNNHFNAVSEWVADQYSGANIASTKQMANVFEKILGAEITEFTPGGSPKVDKVQLQKFSRDFAGAPVGILADAILAARKSQKLASSYFSNILSMNVDGVLHPQINTLAARTSRMCVPTSHLLLTRDGPVHVDDVCVGDETLDADGNWTKVTSIHRYDNAEVVRWDKSLVSTREHRWVWKYEGRNLIHVESTRAGLRHQLQLAPSPGNFDFTLRDFNTHTEGQKFAALIGMLITDGYCVNKGTGVGLKSVVYQTEDKFYDVIKKNIPEEAIMGESSRPVVGSTTGNVSHEIRILTRWLKPRLDAIGVNLDVEDHLKNSTDLIQWVLNLPVDELRSFMSAAFICDGSTSVSHHKIISAQSSVSRKIFAIAGYRLGYLSTEFSSAPSEWSRGLRYAIRFRKAVKGLRSVTESLETSNVWCVSTESGTFTAWSDTPYLTGNSIQDPALQTLPKRDKVVRKAFIPRTEDEIIMSCDLEQVEARVFSCLSSDEGLINLFKFCDSSGEDFFTQILREVYKDPTAGKTDPKRQLIKNMMYGRLYGAGISKMALTAGVPDVEMKEVNDSFDSRFPGMKTLMKQVEHMGMKRLREDGVAYVYTKMGRKLPADDERVYSLVNYLIQGSSAEILKNNILRCDAAGLTDFLIVPVHDELVLSVPKSEQDEIGRILQECMTTRDGWEVPLLAGAPEVGERWGELG